MPGITKVETDLKRDLFVVTYDPAQIDAEAMIREIDALGFTGKQVAAQARASEVPTKPKQSSPQVDELLQRARAENKPLVLLFSGDFCPACTVLERRTLADPKVQEALARVIFHKIMVEADPVAAAQFDIHAIPQLRFISTEGVVVAQEAGVISVETMLARLEQVESKN